MLQKLKNLFFPPPKFQAGDKIYYSNTDFPDKDDYNIILAVGENEYQYGYKDIPGKNSMHIGYIDRNYSKV